jgi:two-component system, chemotaxis family, chemotaxis protein CheY
MSSALQAVRVMLVDDNPHMRAILHSILEGLGIRHIAECNDGASALQMLRKWPADIAIVDFAMAPVDGVEFTYLVRNSPDSADPYLPIIMVTGYADKTRVYEARDAGVTEFIVKPVTARAVVDRLNAVIFKPRPYIKADGYFGPCRRRRQDPNFQGPWLRESDEQAVKDHSGQQSQAAAV